MQQPRVTITPQEGYSEEYSNSVQVRVSLWDFFLQFGRLGKQTQEEVEIEAFRGIYLSPQQAKALHRKLSARISRNTSRHSERSASRPAPPRRPEPDPNVRINA
ncbi:MAG: DUF3467 domain-containing protein [Bryobacterales bacterium]